MGISLEMMENVSLCSRVYWTMRQKRVNFAHVWVKDFVPNSFPPLFFGISHSINAYQLNGKGDGGKIIKKWNSKFQNLLALISRHISLFNTLILIFDVFFVGLTHTHGVAWRWCKFLHSKFTFCLNILGEREAFHARLQRIIHTTPNNIESSSLYTEERERRLCSITKKTT